MIGMIRGVHAGALSRTDDSERRQPSDFVFPKWTNCLPGALAGLGVTGLLAAVAFFYYLAAPDFIEAGYAPDQPIKFSHKLHAGDLSIDCRYCHFQAENSKIAGVPPTEVCMNCHKDVQTGPKYGKREIAKVRAAFEANKPIEWVRIHRLPDYAYFDHSVHVRALDDCEICHGDVAKMEKLRQHAPLSMGWCLSCHRGVTGMSADTVATVKQQFLVRADWKHPESPLYQTVMRAKLNPPDKNCSGCHR